MDEEDHQKDPYASNYSEALSKIVQEGSLIVMTFEGLLD